MKLSISQQTLSPLTARGVQFEYYHDSRRMWSTAIRYSDNSPAPSDDSSESSITILLAGGVSLNQETWLPAIKELFRISSQPGYKLHIHSVWTVEQPNHGDAAVLNAQVLKEHYSKSFQNAHYGRAIVTFIDTYLSSFEQQHLVGIGHSLGCAAFLQALQITKPKIFFNRFILVDPPYVTEEGFPLLMQLHRGIKASNARYPPHWKSTAEAMKWMSERFPLKVCHPGVLDIVAETYFREDHDHPGFIIRKTTTEQETGSFLHENATLQVLPFLRNAVMPVFPADLVVPERKDIWQPALYVMIGLEHEKDRALLHSFTTVPGVGHYMQVENPRLFATTMLDILQFDKRALKKSRL